MAELFAIIGKVERAEIQYEPHGQSRGSGVVEFDSVENAENAISKFDGYMYGGRPLGLTFVRYHGTKQIAIWQRPANFPISVEDLTNIGIPKFSSSSQHRWLVFAWEVPKSMFKGAASVDPLSTGSATTSQDIDISNAIVVSGAFNVYEASTTREHMKKHWGIIGTDILDAIQGALAHMGEVRSEFSFSQIFV